MSRPRVIKDNNGVAIVEGTPASSLIKDVNKFFATKPRERMAGESISQPRKIDPRAINTRSPIQRRPQSERTDEERRANLEAFDRLSEERKTEMTINTRQPTPKDLEQMNNPPVEKPAEVTVARENQIEEKKPIVRGVNPNRNKAKEKAESRRERFFQRRRSRKEAERSQREQESTQGKFITTLGR